MSAYPYKSYDEVRESMHPATPWAIKETLISNLVVGNMSASHAISFTYAFAGKSGLAAEYSKKVQFERSDAIKNLFIELARREQLIGNLDLSDEKSSLLITNMVLEAICLHEQGKTAANLQAKPTE